jgi:hypothetical protein
MEQSYQWDHNPFNIDAPSVPDIPQPTKPDDGPVMTFLKNHEILMQSLFICFIIASIFLFLWVLCDDKLGTFFTRTSKKWMIVSLSIKLILCIATIVLVVKTEK